jgi:probable HAF family extracellular repeat protein
MNVADAINNPGDVVGGALSPKDGTIHAFLWTEDTGMQDLIHHPHASGEDLAPAPQGKTAPAALSEDARKLLQRRSLSGRPR